MHKYVRGTSSFRRKDSRGRKQSAAVPEAVDPGQGIMQGIQVGKNIMILNPASPPSRYTDGCRHRPRSRPRV